MMLTDEEKELIAQLSHDIANFSLKSIKMSADKFPDDEYQVAKVLTVHASVCQGLMKCLARATAKVMDITDKQALDNFIEMVLRHNEGKNES